jgi:perosamine synthetase
MIRLTVPSIDETDLEAVSEVLRSGFLVQGAKVREFEAQVAELIGVQYAVAVTNCTAALQLALLALDIGPGDKVAVTTYSWLSTANVIALCGAEPVFIDIDAETLNMNANALEASFEQHEFKAVLPVHTFGGMADMTRILEIAHRHGIPVIEDAACALGATLHGRAAGTWGVMGCFSFHPRKAITTGEGGIITTNDARIARTLRTLRNHGQDPDATTADFVTPGFNVRLTEFQAALGLTQLQKLERIIQARRAAAARYDALFATSPLRAPRKLEGALHVYQSYVLTLPEALASERTRIIANLKARGIEATIGTYHMPMTTYFRLRGGFKPGDFPVTDQVAACALSLPLFETITEHEQRTVAETLISLVETALHAATPNHG